MRQQESDQEGQAWKQAREYGFDMSLIEDNLRKSPQQRIRHHLIAMRTVETLKAAMAFVQVRR